MRAQFTRSRPSITMTWNFSPRRARGAAVLAVRLERDVAAARRFRHPPAIRTAHCGWCSTAVTLATRSAHHSVELPLPNSNTCMSGPIRRERNSSIGYEYQGIGRSSASTGIFSSRLFSHPDDAR